MAVVFPIIWFGAALLAQSASLNSFELSRVMAPASGHHFFGFDSFGRDLAITVLQASFRSSLFAAVATIASLILALALGLALALATRWVRDFSLRALDLVLAFPSVLFALGWAAVRGPGWGTLFFALFIGSVPTLARLAYFRAAELMAQDFVVASVSLGASRRWLLRQHLGPAVFSLMRVKVPNLFAQALLAEATLTFLGIGAPVGHETWGSLLIQSKDTILEAPRIAITAGVPLILLVLSLQILTEAVESKSHGNSRRSTGRST